MGGLPAGSKTDRTAEDMYDTYSDCLRKQRR